MQLNELFNANRLEISDGMNRDCVCVSAEKKFSVVSEFHKPVQQEER